jgi:hypothetical protein|tara:strand:+ start:566 stop:889 length:324 start_codon:yes stop_codon:yes gene_type:complete
VSDFGIAQRLVIYVQSHPTFDVVEADLTDILATLRAIHPPTDAGTVQEVWEAIRQADAEDEALGLAENYRSFVLVAWAFEPPESVITGVPVRIRFICPRSAYRKSGE